MRDIMNHMWKDIRKKNTPDNKLIDRIVKIIEQSIIKDERNDREDRKQRKEKK